MPTAVSKAFQSNNEVCTCRSEETRTVVGGPTTSTKPWVSMNGTSSGCDSFLEWSSSSLRRKPWR